MIRRLLPSLLGLALGFAALGWGLWTLQQLFTRERRYRPATFQGRPVSVFFVVNVRLRLAGN